MENTIEFMNLRINAMQKRIEKLENIINEINNYYIIDSNIDEKQLTK
jgi:prefoldin subunit 5